MYPELSPWLGSRNEEVKESQPNTSIHLSLVPDYTSRVISYFMLFPSACPATRDCLSPNYIPKEPPFPSVSLGIFSHNNKKSNEYNGPWGVCHPVPSWMWGSMQPSTASYGLLPRLLFSWRNNSMGTGEVTWFSKCAHSGWHAHASRQCPGLSARSSAISHQRVDIKKWSPRGFEEEKTLGRLANQSGELPSRSYTRVTAER